MRALTLVMLSMTAQAANLTVDATQRFQTVDGVGANINVNSWNNGQLVPALDALIDQNGMSLVRVIRDPMDWVSDETDVAKLHQLDAATLSRVYEQPAMKDLWSTVEHLNAKGLKGSAVMLNFMGWTPTWVGGSGAYGVASNITPGKEGEWATVVASLVYYGRKVRNLDFTLLGPLNEEDWNCLEGPCVTPSQYVTFYDALIAELDAMGVGDVRLVGPDCAGSPGNYLTQMMADPAIAGRVDHIGMHDYGGPASPGMSYPTQDYWLTETAASCGNCDYAGTPSQGEWAFAQQTSDAVISDLFNGIAGVLVYDGFDSFYFHHDSFGYWGLMSFDGDAGTYAPRKRFWVNAMVTRFVRPRMVLIQEDDTIASLVTAAAFVDPTGTRLVVVGHNDSSSTMAISGQANGVPGLSSLQLWETTPNEDMQRRADVTVSGSGAFEATISANAFFALTTGTPAQPDGGSMLDAGAPPDAGTGGDAGSTFDGGAAPDAGTGTDAGMPDGGTGSNGGVHSSCGCVAGDAGWWLAGLLVALPWRRRR